MHWSSCEEDFKTCFLYTCTCISMLTLKPTWDPIIGLGPRPPEFKIFTICGCLNNNFTNCIIVVLEKKFFNTFSRYFYAKLWTPLGAPIDRGHNFNNLESIAKDVCMHNDFPNCNIVDLQKKVFRQYFEGAWQHIEKNVLKYVVSFSIFTCLFIVFLKVNLKQ